MAGAIPPGIESFPPWAQIVLTVFGFVIAVLIYGRSLLKPLSTEKSKDVVVPGVSVMDGQIFAQATEQLKQNARQQELRDAQLRDLQRELTTQTDIMRDVRNAMVSACEHLESIDKRLKNELRRQADEREA
jgi:hypothetical protein